MSSANTSADPNQTTYHEEKIGKTLFRITSIHNGDIALSNALEELIVNKVLFEENSIHTKK